MTARCRANTLRKLEIIAGVSVVIAAVLATSGNEGQQRQAAVSRRDRSC